MNENYLCHRSHKYVAKIKGAGKGGKPLYFYTQAAYQAFIKGKDKASEAAYNALDSASSFVDSRYDKEIMRRYGKDADRMRKIERMTPNAVLPQRGTNDYQYTSKGLGEAEKYYRDRYNRSISGLIDKAAYNIKRKSGLELRDRVNSANRDVAEKGSQLNELVKRRKQDASHDAKMAKFDVGSAAQRREDRQWRNYSKTKGYEAHVRKDYKDSIDKATAMKRAYEKTPLGKVDKAATNTVKAVKNAPSNIAKAAKRATTTEYDKAINNESGRKSYESHSKTPMTDKAIAKAQKSSDRYWDAIVGAGAAADNLGYSAAYAKKAVSSLAKGDTAAGKKAAQNLTRELGDFKVNMLGNADYDVVGALPGAANAVKENIKRAKYRRNLLHPKKDPRLTKALEKGSKVLRRKRPIDRR